VKPRAKAKPPPEIGKKKEKSDKDDRRRPKGGTRTLDLWSRGNVSSHHSKDKGKERPRARSQLNEPGIKNGKYSYCSRESKRQLHPQEGTATLRSAAPEDPREEKEKTTSMEKREITDIVSVTEKMVGGGLLLLPGRREE